MHLDHIPALPNFTSSIIRICHDHVRHHGEVAGFSLTEFEQNLNPDSEVPANELEEMLQAVWDEIN